MDVRAVLLAEAAWIGDEAACEKYGVSKRSLQRFRRQAGTDMALMQALEAKRKAFEARWLEDLDLSLGEAIRTIRVCALEVAKDPKSAKNPAIIKELAGSIKMLADVKLANRVIEARLLGLNSGQQPADESHRLQPGEIEIAPGIIVQSPELAEANQAADFTTEVPSLVDLATQEPSDE